MAGEGPRCCDDRIAFPLPDSADGKRGQNRLFERLAQRQTINLTEPFQTGIANGGNGAWAAGPISGPEGPQWDQ